MHFPALIDIALGMDQFPYCGGGPWADNWVLGNKNLLFNFAESLEPNTGVVLMNFRGPLVRNFTCLLPLAS